MLRTLFENFTYHMQYWELHIFDQNFYVTSLILEKKVHIKNYSTNLFFLNFYIRIWKFCENKAGFDKDIKNVWSWDNVQNLKTGFVFGKYGPNRKKNHIINKIQLVINESYV